MFEKEYIIESNYLNPKAFNIKNEFSNFRLKSTSRTN